MSCSRYAANDDRACMGVQKGDGCGRLDHTENAISFFRQILGEQVYHVHPRPQPFIPKSPKVKMPEPRILNRSARLSPVPKLNRVYPKPKPRLAKSFPIRPCRHTTWPQPQVLKQFRRPLRCLTIPRPCNPKTSTISTCKTLHRKKPSALNP